MGGPSGVQTLRVTHLRARPGQLTALLAAARGNAGAAASATGCRSAEVCTDPDDPDTVLVVSRWASRSALEHFLGWHEKVAHGSLAASMAEPPRSVHYAVVDA